MKHILSLLTLLTAVGAHAQYARFEPGEVCWYPSAEQCADVDYQRSTCGRRHRQRCTDMLLDDAEDASQGAPVITDTNPDGTLVDTRVMPADTHTMRVYGMQGRYAGDPLRQQMLSVEPSNGGSNWALFGHRIQRARWADNGNAVDSCAEYVHERWYDYSVFEDAAAYHGDDWRTIHDLAWDGAVLDARLYSKDRRRSFNRPSPDRRRQRNAFAASDVGRWQAQVDLFRAAIPEHPALQDRADEITLHDFDGALRAKTDRTRGWFDETWDWHADANAALADEPDALLIYLEDQAAAFKGTLARRDAAVEAVYAADRAYTLAASLCRGIYFQGRYRPGQDCHRVDDAADDLVDALNALGRMDGELEDALRAGDALGCIEDEAIGRCDWSPRTLVLALEGRYLDEREADFDRCEALTGDDFAPLEDPQWLRDAYCAVRSCRYTSWPASFATGTYWVDVYLRRVELWVDALDLPTDPTTGDPLIAESAQDSGSNGDGRFGIEFDYTLGWNVSEFAQDGVPNTCRADLAVAGTINVEATAFGYSTGEGGRPSLFDATFALVADGDVGNDGHQDLDVDASVIVFGNAFDPIELEDTSFHFADDLGHSGDITPRVSLAAPVAGIPLTLRGWMSGRIGARYAINGGVSRKCNQDEPTVDIGFRGDFTPYAAVDGHATASLDFYVVDVGVGVDLNLIDLSLPFQAELALRLGDGAAELVASAGLDLDIASLAGRIKVFVEPFIGDGWQRTLFAWKGLRDRVSLFGETWSYPLDHLARALAARQ